MNTIRPVALVLINIDGKILACRGVDTATGLEFCRPIGGGIEFGESSSQAIIREVKEEIGATLVNPILVDVIENVFEYKGESFHEIVFLYTGELNEAHIISHSEIPILDKPGHIAEWFSTQEIQEGRIHIRPAGIEKSI